MPSSNLKAEPYPIKDNASIYSRFDDDGENPSVASNRMCFTRFCTWFRQKFSVGTRNLVYIFPGLAILSVPAVLGWTVYKGRYIATVPLEIWALWLAICWFAFFASRFVMAVAPDLFEWIFGLFSSKVKRYMDYWRHLHFYVSNVTFFLAALITFNPIIVAYNENGGVAVDWQDTAHRILAVLFISSCIIGLEKLLLQVIAVKFHQTTYQDRIAQSKYQIAILSKLLAVAKKRVRRPSVDALVTNRSFGNQGRGGIVKIFKTTKNAIEKTTSVLGHMASEITGQKFDPNANFAETTVLHYLQSSHGARALGRRLFQAFCPHKRAYLTLDDVRDVFQTEDEAENAFYMFDKDGNGDLTKEEMLILCVEAYKERQAISASLRDLDNAVGKLDSILMVAIYFVIILLFIAFLNVSFQTYIATAGSVLVALSFMVGSTAQAVFESIIFLFVRHPFDVGDRVVIEGETYIVNEMSLMTTTLTRSDGRQVHVANKSLAELFIHNIRRSGHMTDETFIEVDFYTSFEQIEALRKRMVEFLKTEERDFYPQLELTVEKLVKLRQILIKISVIHKSNWQDDGLTSRRKNKFMCMLKTVIIELDIQGPYDSPNFPADRMIPPNRSLRNPHNHSSNDVRKADFTLGVKSDVFDVDENRSNRQSIRRRKTERHTFGSDEEDEVHNHKQELEPGRVDIVVPDEKAKSDNNYNNYF